MHTQPRTKLDTKPCTSAHLPHTYTRTHTHTHTTHATHATLTDTETRIHARTYTLSSQHVWRSMPFQPDHLPVRLPDSIHVHHVPVCLPDSIRVCHRASCCHRYGSIWLETQPMGGAAYGVRNLRLALNNQLAFMRTQRQDGRLPGIIEIGKTFGVIHPSYSYPGNANHSMLQGFYMATPAVDVAFLMNLTVGQTDTLLAQGQQQANTAAYLTELQSVLEKFDGWLWSARNSSHGVLWLQDTADTGEDGSDRLQGYTAPFESMDMMGYSHDAQRALARIAAIQRDDAAVRRWKARAAATAASLKRRLWRAEVGACFDRERDGSMAFVPTLVHNNLRAMWHNAFDQGMADTFVARHLMNRSEFWTPTPLTSISVSDPRFHNRHGNDWSGPSEGLTFQRARQSQIRPLRDLGGIQWCQQSRFEMCFAPKNLN